MQPGVSLHLKCIASGNPTPEINWELDSKRLSSTERYVNIIPNCMNVCILLNIYF